MSNKVKIAPAKKLKISPQQNAKALAAEVQKRMKSKFMARFEEFIEDCDDKLRKGQGAIDDNEFAKTIVFESDRSDDPKAKAIIESFQTAIDMTKATLVRTKSKREASIKLRQIIKKEKVVTPLEVVTLFDIVMGT